MRAGNIGISACVIGCRPYLQTVLKGSQLRVSEPHIRIEEGRIVAAAEFEGSCARGAHL